MLDLGTGVMVMACLIMLISYHIYKLVKIKTKHFKVKNTHNIKQYSIKNISNVQKGYAIQFGSY